MSTVPPIAAPATPEPKAFSRFILSRNLLFKLALLGEFTTLSFVPLALVSRFHGERATEASREIAAA